MGYNLTIGQAVVNWNEDYVCVDAEEVTKDEAPAYGEPTDNSNQRWPSYISWSDFCRKIGIEKLMFSSENYGKSSEFEVPRNGDDGETTWLPCLINNHPGVSPIVQGHYDFIKKKVDSYKANNPTHKAEYGDSESQDGSLCRAEWLLYWLKWSLDNCDKPIFYNS